MKRKKPTLCTFLRIDHAEKIVAMIAARAELSREWQETVDELRESIRRAREARERERS